MSLQARLEGVELSRVEPTDEVVRAADAVVIVTDHTEFDYRHLTQWAALVLGTRNATGGLRVPPGARIGRL